jgi:plastocyanin
MRRTWTARLVAGGLLMVAAVVGGAATVRSGAGSAAAAGQETAPVAETLVVMVDNRFHPDALVIAAGTTVVWRNEEADPQNAHDVLTLDGTLSSPLIFPGESWSFTFTVPGTYDYFCDIHEGMLAQVVVTEAG